MVYYHAPRFKADEVAAIRAFCEGELRDEVASIQVSDRDHGACVGLIVNLKDGHRAGFVTVSNGHDDANAGARLVDLVRRRMAERQAGANS
jgi:hypothetical protein